MKNIDLRLIKTYKALLDAIARLLMRKNFNDITVNDICKEAVISRATFYTHFTDKYDLLRYYSYEVKKNIIKNVYNFDELCSSVNQFIAVNKKIIKNVFTDANSETLMIIRDLMASIVNLTIKRKLKNKNATNHIILFNFFVGGLINHLNWMVQNNFPANVAMLNDYFYKMIENLTNWDAEQEIAEKMAKI